MTAHSTNNRKKTRGHRPRLQQSKRTPVGAVCDRAFSLLAQRYGHASAPSMAVYGPSDLLHHGLHLQSSPDSGSAGCTHSFIEFGFRACEYRVWVGHYVIMPDHIHLFAGFGPESITLSGWMKSLKNAISKTLKNATFRAPHWQKGFFDHVIRSQESYDQKWFYVRDNPVRAGLVQSAEDWPYTGQICNLPLL